MQAAITRVTEPIHLFGYLTSFFAATLFSEMTAIVIVQTHHGFAIAADGRARFPDDSNPGAFIKSKEKNSEEKLFHFQNSKINLVYTLAGAPMNDDESFDVRIETRKELERIGERQSPTFYGLIDELTEHLCKLLNHARYKNDLGPCRNSGEPFLVLYFCGYFIRDPQNVVPQYMQACFYYRNQEITTHIGVARLWPLEENGQFAGTGSSKVVPLIRDGDPRFLKYHRALTAESSLDEAADYARALVEGQASPEACLMDKQFCEGIGGRIRTATISPEGFKWI